MIYIQSEGYHFTDKIKEIVALFYQEDEIQEEPINGKLGSAVMNLVCQVWKQDTHYEIQIQLFVHGVLACIEKDTFDPLETEMDPKDGDRLHKSLQREVRRLVYILLEKYTGKTMPWGILTGIRPAKIVHQMIEAGYVEEDILERLVQFYRLSNKKAELLYEVARKERGILETSRQHSVSLYIGIPFCTTRCGYCSFISNTVERCRPFIGDYLEAMKKEIRFVSGLAQSKGIRIQSLYIGGGTPTSLQDEELKELLVFIENTLDLSHTEEYTLEAGRPDSLNKEKLKTIKRSAVSRISINPQSMDDETLKRIGRAHTALECIQAFYWAREIGFGNINMDIIAGLPGEDRSIFENTLDEVCRLGPESLTVHAMALKRASSFYAEGQMPLMADKEEASAMVEMAEVYARSMGMQPYYLYRQKNITGNLENTGYARPGFESIYNIQIMEEKQTILACGAGAVSKVVDPEGRGIKRAFNVKNIEDYIQRVDEMVERKKAILLPVL